MKLFFSLNGLVKRRYGRLSVTVVVSAALLTCLLLCYLLRSEGDSSEEILHFIVDNTQRRDFSRADNVSGFAEAIVPNIVHFIRFDNPELDFYDMLTLRAVSLHQRPERILLHCNFASPTGRFWQMVKDLPGLEVRFLPRPTHIFGHRLSHVWHAGDVARIIVLTVYGGIFLDNDVFVVRSLDPFRKYEMALGWPQGALMGTQVLVAHRDARFLRLWYQSYRQYRPNLWYYNAGELPTTSILYRRPQLVHRVPELFGVRDVSDMLYQQNNATWRSYIAIHLMKRHTWYKYSWDYLVGRKFDFDEEKVKTLNTSFGEMARLVLYGSTNLISDGKPLL